MASDVILLTDTVLWGEIGNGRYMGAYAIATGVRKRGLKCTVIDYFTRHPDFFNYLKNFLSSETSVIGISSTFLAPLNTLKKFKQRSESVETFYSGELWFEKPENLREWLRELREVINVFAPQAKLVLGGVKSQFAIWRPENFKEFDYVFLGAADHSFAEFVEQIKAGQSPKLREFHGLNLVDNSFDIENKSCPVALWTDGDAIRKGESLPLEVARGCIFNCKFCHYNKRASFKKSISDLRDELIRNYEKFGVDTYSLCDDCFNDHPQKVQNICEMFLKLPFKIEWTSYARFDVAAKFPWTLELMIESGARGLYWGVESFDYEVAKRAGKGTHPDKVKEILYLLHDKYRDRCITEISLIAGLPGETSESLQNTLDWLTQNPIVHLVTIGSLGLVSYVENFDQKVIDYADYSRQPEKYGFKDVRFKPHYWEHETMNLYEAQVWAKKIAYAYYLARPSGAVKTIWAYPHLKTLGYSSAEAFNFFNPQESTNYLEEFEKRFKDYLSQYWTILRERVEGSYDARIDSQKSLQVWI